MKNKNYFFNKKGSDKILSMYWFVVIIIVAGGIFAMIYMFYSAPYDVREVESEILSNKIADCISRNGRIDSSFVLNKNLSVIKECSLNFNVESEFNEEQYFFDIEISSLEEESSKISFSGGNINWKEDCFIEDKKGKEYKRLVKCNEKRIYAVDDSKQYLIKIISGVGKSEKNVRL
jgi:uncharacterized protein involved in tolerance to divalent cations